MRISTWALLLGVVAIVSAPRPAQTTGVRSRVCVAESFGARHDGVADDTKALQAALDGCADGGVVRLTQGVYLSGPVFLHSHETLDIAQGSTLLGVADHARYVQTGKSRLALVNARLERDVALVGKGVIDGQGGSWWAEARIAKAQGIEPVRPRLVLLTEVDGVLVKDLTLQNSPMFHLVPARSRNVMIDGVTIRSPADAPNTDGIDPSGREMVIQNSLIDVGDDNIAIKSGQEDPAHPGAATADIVVRDCTFLHGHGLSIGSETNGGVDNVVADRIRFDGTVTALRIKTLRGRGGPVTRIAYRNISMANVRDAILITAYYPKIPDADSGQPIARGTPDIHDIRLQNVVATTGVKSLGGIFGLPERAVRDVRFDNVQLTAEQGLTVRHAQLTLVHTQLSAGRGEALIRQQGADVHQDGGSAGAKAGSGAAR